MATEQASAPVNGTYAPHQAQSYSPAEQNYAAVNANSVSSPNAGYGTATAGAPSTSSAGNSVSQIPKDEVAWYFVERYYNTLSKTTERLFLFYNKHSQFVSGDETERVSVCLGQKAISERIKELDFQDCKVRVTNVDSQASGEKNIVIQTIGEISNKSKPHRKFVQTFLLAEQANGYFVLNDIFRYLQDDDIEEEEEAVPHEPAAVSGAAEDVAPIVKEEDEKGEKEIPSKEPEAAIVDKKLEEVIDEQAQTPEAATQASGTNGTPAEVKTTEVETAPAVVPTADVSKEVAESVAAEETQQPEKPKDPEPTPAPTQKTSPAPRATPAAPPKPVVPKTWASLAASANKSAAPAQAPAPAAPPKPAQPKQANQPAASAAQAGPSVSMPPQREASPAGSNPDSAGWQTAGADHGRKQSRSQGQAEAPKARAYIKNVYPAVDADALRASLERCGEVIYFDVSRQKNCAFVDFATTSGFQAAVNANPHKIGTEEIYVEERREGPPRYGSFRGGMRGRGGAPDRQGQGRGGFGKDGGRGNYTPRGGRGGNVSQRTRGGPQAA